MLGSGPTKNKIGLLIEKLKLRKNIKILPFQKNPFSFIKKSQIFILSSKYEGLPNSLLEAIALKKPVISSNCPTGPSEILDKGKGGHLFAVGDYKSLANKIELYIKEKNQIEKKRKHAYKRLIRFNFEQRLYDYYKEIKVYF